MLVKQEQGFDFQWAQLHIPTAAQYACKHLQALECISQKDSAGYCCSCKSAAQSQSINVEAYLALSEL